MTSARTFTARELEERGVLLVQDGNHGNDRPRSDEFVDRGTAFIRAADMKDGRIDFTGSGNINPAAVERIRKGHGLPGDVLLSHKGTIGKVAVAPADSPRFVCSPQTTFWRSLDPATLSQHYLRYVLQSSEFVSQLNAAKNQTDMAPYVSLTQQRAFRITLPPLPEQQAIAEVLGALDDKIAANTRLAATATEALEIEAELRWFRRPGPTAPLTNFVDVAPQTPKPSSDEPTYVDMRALPERGMTIGSWTTRAPKGGARFANGDTLVARITPCLENRKTGYVDFLDDGEVAVGSTEFIVLRPQPGVAGPIGYFLAVGSEFRSFAIQHMVGSSGRQRVAAADVAQFEIPEPDHDWLAEFNSRATSTFDHLRSMAAENRTLAATRDALLPQLMSGKIRVRDIEGVAE